jgi:hypothetical protein
MRRKISLLSAPVLALMMLAGSGRADYFYNFSPIDFPTVYSDHSGMGINITNQPQVGPIATSQDTNVVAATLSTFINPGVTGTDTFTTGQHSTIALTIVDGLENGTVEFGVKFSGSLAADNSRIQVEFDGPSSKTVTVNGQQYTVSLDNIVPPGVPGAIPGSIGGHILAGIDVGEPPPDDENPPPDDENPPPDDDNPPPDDGGNPNPAPEPSSLVLAGLGLSLIGARAWRRFRQVR